MSKAFLGDGIAEGLDDVILAEDGIEGLGAVFSGKNLVAHGRSVGGGVGGCKGDSLAVGGWQLAVGSWQLAVISCQLSVVSWRFVVGFDEDRLDRPFRAG